MRRIISAEEIVESYKKSGIKPTNYRFVDCDQNGKFCGCAITSLYVAYHGVLPEYDSDGKSAVIKWGIDYFGPNIFKGILNGFDNPHYTYVGLYITSMMRQANEASLAAVKLGLS